MKKPAVLKRAWRTGPGVMMRGPRKGTCVAVRQPDGEILPRCLSGRIPGRNGPSVRGIFNFIDSLVSGYKCPAKSAGHGEDATWRKQSSIKWVYENSATNRTNFIMAGGGRAGRRSGACSVYGGAPLRWLGAAGAVSCRWGWRALIEGVKFKSSCWWATALVSRTIARECSATMAREHKTIARCESGRELTVENAPLCFHHPRCGSASADRHSISILAGALINTEKHRCSIALVVKAVACRDESISYEIIASRPAITTASPARCPHRALVAAHHDQRTDGMIECAIAAVLPVPLPGKSRRRKMVIAPRQCGDRLEARRYPGRSSRPRSLHVYIKGTHGCPAARRCRLLNRRS